MRSTSAASKPALVAGADFAAHAHPGARIEALMPPPLDVRTETRPWWRRALLAALPFVVGAAVGVGLARVGVPALDAVPPREALALLAGFLVSLWPHIVLHEAGHAVAGVMRGMQAIAFGVGPLRAERGGDARWRWRHGGGIAGIGGFAALLPRAERGHSPLDQAVFLLGGPAANLATAAIFAAVATWAPLSALPAAACTGIALAAALLGLGNLVPLHRQGWRSDGRGLLDLVRGTPDAALQVQINQLVALGLAGVRPRDWPEASMPAMDEAVASSGLQSSGRMLRLSRAVDRRDAEAAWPDALALTAGFAAAPAVVQGAIAVSLASHAALLVRDRALVSAWRLHCHGGLMDLSPYRAWLDAEIAGLDGDTTAVATHVGHARALADRIPDTASRRVFDERLDALLEHGSTDGMP
ncbi:site-2 protease family protein [Luteimonas deserti]|uniref:Peptidase M50 domain-containing protein n=1 Tax=Luteimonas deserti TaxID=2752306 RepID=A0A7Z0QQF8_9GAMM|nr:site-2 protease family protein [Luteimonas deserti]NYZ61845.1 hypothetical protein [Luteimonas deserti]